MATSDDFKKKLKAGDIGKALKLALSEVIELKITTWVATTNSTAAKPGNRIQTRINIVDGDIDNEVGSQFLDRGPYSELWEFHLSQVKAGRATIQTNLDSLQQLVSLCVEMIHSDPNAPTPDPNPLVRQNPQLPAANSRVTAEPTPEAGDWVSHQPAPWTPTAEDIGWSALESTPVTELQEEWTAPPDSWTDLAPPLDATGLGGNEAEFEPETLAPALEESGFLSELFEEPVAGSEVEASFESTPESAPASLDWTSTEVATPEDALSSDFYADLQPPLDATGLATDPVDFNDFNDFNPAVSQPEEEPLSTLFEAPPEEPLVEEPLTEDEFAAAESVAGVESSLADLFREPSPEFGSSATIPASEVENLQDEVSLASLMAAEPIAEAEVQPTVSEANVSPAEEPFFDLSGFDEAFPPLETPQVEPSLNPEEEPLLDLGGFDEDLPALETPQPEPSLSLEEESLEEEFSQEEPLLDLGGFDEDFPALETPQPEPSPSLEADPFLDLSGFDEAFPPLETPQSEPIPSPEAELLLDLGGFDDVSTDLEFAEPEPTAAEGTEETPEDSPLDEASFADSDADSDLTEFSLSEAAPGLADLFTGSDADEPEEAAPELPADLMPEVDESLVSLFTEEEVAEEEITEAEVAEAETLPAEDSLSSLFTEDAGDALEADSPLDFSVPSLSEEDWTDTPEATEDLADFAPTHLSQDAADLDFDFEPATSLDMSLPEVDLQTAPAVDDLDWSIAADRSWEESQANAVDSSSAEASVEDALDAEPALNGFDLEGMIDLPPADMPYYLSETSDSENLELDASDSTPGTDPFADLGLDFGAGDRAPAEDPLASLDASLDAPALDQENTFVPPELSWEGDADLSNIFAEPTADAGDFSAPAAGLSDDEFANMDFSGLNLSLDSSAIEQSGEEFLSPPDMPAIDPSLDLEDALAVLFSDPTPEVVMPDSPSVEAADLQDNPLDPDLEKALNQELSVEPPLANDPFADLLGESLEDYSMNPEDPLLAFGLEPEEPQQKPNNSNNRNNRNSGG